MKNLLILFAKGFPYNISEPFLEKEYPLYHKYFDKVLIVTGCKRHEKPKRAVNAPEIEIISDDTLDKNVKSILSAVPWVLSDRMFWKELRELAAQKMLTGKRLYALAVTSLCGNHRAMLARRWLKKNAGYEVKAIYSYWLQIPAYAAVRLNTKIYHGEKFTVSRCHGFDLYEERSSIHYLPFHRQLYEKVSEIASISVDGKQYLEKKYGALGKVSVAHLGAFDQGKTNPVCSREKLRLVSCSRAIPLKRIHRIIDALTEMTDIPVRWTHLGGGSELESLREYASRLPENVEAVFSGTISNEEVYGMYEKNPYHVFLNVSQSEGVPVSIMEAMSFSIPVIATDVGGTKELVDQDINGFLLPEDFRDEDLRTMLYMIRELPEREYLQMREQAQIKFKEEYDAVSNYDKFLKHIAGKGSRE